LQGMVPYARKQIMGTKHNAKYVVTLTSEERKELLELVKKGKAAAYKIKHANVLLASDENGENLPATMVAKAYHCHARTVYNIRQRFVEQGLPAAVERKKYATPGPRKMDGRTEARLVALACEQTPEGISRWSLRLLGERMVDLGVVASISHETVRRTLKKTSCGLT
jgi:transposase